MTVLSAASAVWRVCMALAKATLVKAQAVMVDGVRDQAPSVAGLGVLDGLEG